MYLSLGLCGYVDSSKRTWKIKWVLAQSLGSRVIPTTTFQVFCGIGDATVGREEWQDVMWVLRVSTTFCGGASVSFPGEPKGRQGEGLEQLTLSSCPDMLPLSPDRKFHLAPCFWPSLLLISLISIRIKVLRMSENFEMTFLTKPWPKKIYIYPVLCQC